MNHFGRKLTVYATPRSFNVSSHPRYLCMVHFFGKFSEEFVDENGNVMTAEEVEALKASGADIVEEIQEEVIVQPPAPAVPETAPEESSGGGGGFAAMIAASAKKRTDRIETEGPKPVPAPAPAPPPPASAPSSSATPPPAGGMAAMIAASAKKRNDRIESGGEKKITDSGNAPQEAKGGMAAMIAASAQKRNDRIESGGELQVREVPEEHREVFVTIADAAAGVGRLTRLDEHVVEAVVPQKEEVVDDWVPSGLRSDNERSTFFAVIHEAAALGAMKGPRPDEVTNYDPVYEEEEEEEEVDIDKLAVDAKGRRTQRVGFLLDAHVKDHQKNKKKDWAAENQVLQQGTNIDNVALPSIVPPTWRPEAAPKSQKELMDAIAQGVAEASWSRRYRLDRPNVELNVTKTCNCKYCKHPNPYQTHKYKKIVKEGANIEELIEKEKQQKIDEYKRSKAWTPPKRTEPPKEFQEQAAAAPATFNPQKVKTLVKSTDNKNLQNHNYVPGNVKSFVPVTSTPEKPKPLKPPPKKVFAAPQAPAASTTGLDKEKENNDQFSGTETKDREERRRQRKRKKTTKKSKKKSHGNGCACVIM